jgi:Ca2+-binding EF-hand superfamily protein
MSNAIGGIGGGSSMMMQGMGRMQRQDPTKMAESLFAKLDTSGKGYIEKADLQTAFQSVSTLSGASADDVFASLDGDSDGKVTQQEMSDSNRTGMLSSLIDNFDQVDTDGNGKVSFEETRAYKQSSQQSTVATTNTSSEAQMLMQIMNLAQAYGLDGTAASSTGLSVIA